MNKPVSFPLAKLLSVKGYNEPCLSIFIDGELQELRNAVTHEIVVTNDKFMTSRYVTAPLISDVVMWIYERHRVWISPYQYRDHAADNNDEFVFRTHQTGMQ